MKPLINMKKLGRDFLISQRNKKTDAIWDELKVEIEEWYEGPPYASYARQTSEGVVENILSEADSDEFIPNLKKRIKPLIARRQEGYLEGLKSEIKSALDASEFVRRIKTGDTAFNPVRELMHETIFDMLTEILQRHSLHKSRFTNFELLRRELATYAYDYVSDNYVKWMDNED